MQSKQKNAAGFTIPDGLNAKVTFDLKGERGVQGLRVYKYLHWQLFH